MKKPIKRFLLNAFEESETKSVVDICRIAKVSRGTFYFHYKKDPNFRRTILEKQREHLAKKIAIV